MAQPEKVELRQPTRPRVAQVVRELAPSGIRAFFDLVLGRDDIISLGVGEPDFVTPWRVREAAIYSIGRGETSYTSNAGILSLRKAISGYLAERFAVQAAAEDEVLVTVGASEGIDLALRAILDPGDEVVIPEPCFVAYEALVRLAGGVARLVPTRAEAGFALDWEAIEKAIGQRTRAILINYPSNPTGMTLGADDVVRLARLAAAHELIIISDEIYAELSYEGPHVSMASVPEAADWTVLISGFSKAFAMTGWRIGYVAGPAEIIGAMHKIHQYSLMCAPIMSQRAAEAALAEARDDVSEMVETYRQRRNYFHKGLAEIGLQAAMPAGAFYVFPSIASTGLSSEDFCAKLLKEESVAVVPGTAFGPSGEGCVRASYAVDFDTLDRALEGIGRFLTRL